MSKAMTPEQKAQTKEFMKYMGKASCVECDVKDAHSRGLCTTCYQSARRAGELDQYPTTALTADPDAFARMIFRFYPEILADIAIEYGYAVVKSDLPPMRPFGAPKDWVNPTKGD